MERSDFEDLPVVDDTFVKKYEDDDTIQHSSLDVPIVIIDRKLRNIERTDIELFERSSMFVFGMDIEREHIYACKSLEFGSRGNFWSEQYTDTRVYKIPIDRIRDYIPLETPTVISE